MVLLIESKMSNIENNKRAVPAPIAHPIMPIVQGKNYLPAKATTNPNTIAIGPSM